MPLLAFNNPRTRGVITITQSAVGTSDPVSMFVQAEQPHYVFAVIPSGAADVSIEFSYDDPLTDPSGYTWISPGPDFNNITTNTILTFTGHINQLRVVVATSGSAIVQVRMPYKS